MFRIEKSVEKWYAALENAIQSLKKAEREELLIDNDGSWYVGYDADGKMIPYALIVDRRVVWYAAPLSSIQMFALKRRLNLFSAFM